MLMRGGGYGRRGRGMLMRGTGGAPWWWREAMVPGRSPVERRWMKGCMCVWLHECPLRSRRLMVDDC